MGFIRFGLGDKALIYLSSVALSSLLLTSKALLLYVLVSFVGVAWYVYDDKQHWRRLGVVSPPYSNPLFGNTLTLMKNGMHRFDMANVTKLGETHGVYLFDRKELVTSDMDFLREVMVKKSPYFQNRLSLITNPKSKTGRESLMRNMMSVLMDEDWKRVRNRTTPAFTTGKMKGLLSGLNDSSRLLCDVVERHAVEGKDLALKEVFGRFALDVIARAGFSQDLNTYSDLFPEDFPDGHVETNQFIENVKLIFSVGFFGWRAAAAAFCPYMAETMEEWLGVDMFQGKPHLFFRDFLLRLYDERKAMAEPPTDMFQLLMEAAEDDENLHEMAKDKDLDSDIIHSEFMNGEKGQQSAAKKKMTKIELLAQGFLLLIAGYETTGTTMHFMAYALACHPEAQERLRQEVLDVCGDGEGDITYDHAIRMPYMQAVIAETLRMFPAAPRTGRECNSAITIKGVPFREGDTIAVPIYAIHYDPQHYPEPEQFRPERFLPEAKASRDPLTWLPFGYGPRNCIGMRLAEFEMRIGMATFLRKYRLVKADSAAEFPPEVCSRQLLKAANTLYARAEKI